MRMALSFTKLAPLPITRRRLPTALTSLCRHELQLFPFRKPLLLPPLVLLNQALHIAILRPPRRHRELHRQRTLVAVFLRDLSKSHQLRQQARIPQRSGILQALVEMYALFLQFEEALELLCNGGKSGCFFAVLRRRRRRVGDVEVGDGRHGEFAETLARESVG
jgi:hypothetical protein